MTIFLIPFGLVVKASGVDLNWVMLFGFVITIPCFPAVALSIFFSKTTGPGVISGKMSTIIIIGIPKLCLYSIESNLINMLSSQIL